MKDAIVSYLAGVFTVALVLGLYAAGVINLLWVPATGGWGAVAYAVVGIALIVAGTGAAIATGHDLRAYSRARVEHDS